MLNAHSREVWVRPENTGDMKSQDIGGNNIETTDKNKNGTQTGVSFFTSLHLVQSTMYLGECIW